MPRYLVRFEPEYQKEVREGLEELDYAPIRKYFDYFEVEVPREVIPEIERIPHVVYAKEARRVGVVYKPIAIERKLRRFMELDPLSAMKFSAEEEKPDLLTTLETGQYIGADKAHEIGVTGKGVKVAVLDTGIDPTCIQFGPLPNAYSAVDGMPFWGDECGHGTWVATCIGGRELFTPFGLIRGIAPDAEIYHIKVLGYVIGAGSEADVMEGMMEAFRRGADIISMSLGSPYTQEPTDEIPECRAVRMLTREGVICCVANGNDGPDSRTVGVPACESTALSVGAVDPRTGEIAEFSSRGPTQENGIKPDIVEPGVSILSSSVGLIDMMEFRDLFKLAAISGTCLVGETLVNDVPISELNVGDIVTGISGDDIVINTMDQGTNRTYEVIFEDGRSIQGTPDHKFLVLDGNTLKWKSLILLSKGDNVVEGSMCDMWREIQDNNSLAYETQTRNFVGGISRKISRCRYRLGRSPLQKGTRALEQGKKDKRKTERETIQGNERKVEEREMEKRIFGEKPSYRKKPYGKFKSVFWSSSIREGKKGIKKEDKSFAERRQNYKRKDKGGTEVFERKTYGTKKTFREKRLYGGASSPRLTRSRFDFDQERRGNSCRIRFVQRNKREIGQIQEIGFLRQDDSDKPKVAEVKEVRRAGKRRVFDITTLSHTFGSEDGIIVHNSMSTPHSSALIALIKQLYRENCVELTSNMVKDMMERYGESKTNDRGWGLLTWSIAERYLKEAL